MSIEIHVFFRGKLPDTAALTRELRDLGFRLSVTPPHYPLEDHSGFMPMQFARDETGVEFFIDDGRDAVEDALSPEQIAQIDPTFDRCASFRWSSAEDETTCGLCCAAALAKLVNGIVFEETEGVLWSVQTAITEARKNHKELAGKADPKLGTQTRHIKRYLKSLLQKRSDLVLVGRSLLIRPVRHFLRGAILDRTSDRYHFAIYRYLLPLHVEFDHLGFSKELEHRFSHVWQPYFEPFLIDRLKEDVFEPIGQITTLTELADYAVMGNVWGGPSALSEKITNLVLSGERDRAADIVRQVENGEQYDDGGKKRLRERWALLSRDIETVCAEFHEKEAKLIKEMKLEHIWEPSPFPVEVPVARRKAETSEISFSVDPWIEQPPGLLQDALEMPGSIQFARDVFERNERPILLATITREEAEERHRALESYVLATRLLDDTVLILRRSASHDRNDPDTEIFTLPMDFHITMWSPSRVITARGSQDSYNKALMHLKSVSIDERDPRQSLWRFIAFLDRDKIIDDSRTNKRTDTSLSDLDRRVLTCKLPDFGEYTELAEQIGTVMHHGGYWSKNQTRAGPRQRLKTFFKNLWRK